MISPRSLCSFAHDIDSTALSSSLTTIEIVSGASSYVFDQDHTSYRLSTDGLSSRIIIHTDYIDDGIYEMLLGLSGDRIYDLRAVNDHLLETLIVRLSATLYRFDLFMSKKEATSSRLPIIIVKSGVINLDKIMAMIEAQTLARDLVNLPPNAKSPHQYAKIIKSLDWKHHTIIDTKDVELRQEGCGLITAVASGGNEGAHIICITPHALASSGCDRLIAGKGVVFDAGGLQIKPDTGMLDMKCDMA